MFIKESNYIQMILKEEGTNINFKNVIVNKWDAQLIYFLQ
jgi:hypothetical protein